jgi:hypothetical protein
MATKEYEKAADQNKKTMGVDKDQYTPPQKKRKLLVSYNTFQINQRVAAETRALANRFQCSVGHFNIL